MLFHDLSESQKSILSRAYIQSEMMLMGHRIESNATFKKAKGDIVKKSWHEHAPGNSDKLYWLNGHVYERLDVKSWSAIESGRAKL